MGELKDKTLPTSPSSEDIQQHKLSEAEANYLRLLNISLQYHTLGQKIMSGYLYYVCTQRLGYKSGVNLKFEFNFDNQDNMLTVQLMPDNITAPPAAPPVPEQPATPANEPAEAPQSPEDAAGETPAK